MKLDLTGIVEDGFICLMAAMGLGISRISLSLGPSAPKFLGPLSSLTRSAYLKVLIVCSQFDEEGETVAIMQVLAFPVNESLRT